MTSSSSFRLAVRGGLLIAYVAIVVAATMAPTPLGQGYAAAAQRVLGVLYRNGVPEWFGYNNLESTAKHPMFLPLGFLIALTRSRPFWWPPLAPIRALSALIEVVQDEFLAERFASALDVVANSIGGYIGVTIAKALRGLVHGRDRLPAAEALGSSRAPEAKDNLRLAFGLVRPGRLV